MNKARYVLDTSSFVNPFHLFYPLESVPGFWDALIRENQKGFVFTLDCIKKEIQDQELINWMKQPDKSFVKEVDEETLQTYGEMVQWVQNHSFFSIQEKQKFSRVVDGQLVAYAKVHSMTVVTEEKFIAAPNTKQIKIPNICKVFNVPCITVSEMLIKLEIRLILEGQKRHDLFSKLPEND